MGTFDSEMLSTYRLVDELWAKHFTFKQLKKVNEWADENRIMPAGSPVPGPWHTDRTPYIKKIYELLSEDSYFEDIVLMFGTQLGKTDAAINWIGSIIDQCPDPILVVQPDTETAKRFSITRIEPLIELCASVRCKISKNNVQKASNKAQLKQFLGGDLYIVPAGSAKQLASIQSKYNIYDEKDSYPLDVQGEGNVVSLSKARQDNYPGRKRLHTSTPKLPKGQSLIEKDYLSGTQYKYHVPCPDCGSMQVLFWNNLKYHKTDDGVLVPDSVGYVCSVCAVLIPEFNKTKMLAQGDWLARFPDRKIQSFHLNSLYSPIGWLSWNSMIEQWILANIELKKGSDNEYKTFINTRLAETVAEQAEQLEANELLKNAEDWQPDVVPMGGLIVLVGVDVQDDRIECFPWAFGEQDQMWMLKPEVIMGNPGEDDTWAKLDLYLQTRYPHASGQTLGIEAVAIDTGGHYTHSVYNYVRRAHPARKIAAIKGDNHKPGIPILGKASTVDVNWRGGIVKEGCKLWNIGVNTAKDLLHNRLKRPGMVHLSKHMAPEMFDQLVAEKRVAQRTARGIRFMWVKPHSNTRNEALDGAVYAIWCAERLGINRYPQKVWESIRERVQPRVGSLFDQPVKTPEINATVKPATSIKKQKTNSMPRQSLLSKMRGRM